MFQRLKGAIDSRIAEEQARQRTSQSPSRSNSGANKQAVRAKSPSKRVARSEAKDDEPSPKGPDPSEFEPEGIINAEDISGRSGTPRPTSKKDRPTPPTEVSSTESHTSFSDEKPDKAPAAEPGVESQELPTDVRVKLRKLDKLESRYYELLKSYRVAHARVLSIEPFETSLRENTPLTSISDPTALVEYLNQLNLKGDMVLDELKRVSTERDKFKEELSQAQQDAKDAWDEVANLRNRSIPNGLVEISNEQIKESRSQEEPVSHPLADKSPLSENPQANVSKSRTTSITSLPVFSPKSKPAESPVAQVEKEDFFSYETELPRVESELLNRQKEVSGLQAEVKTLKGDLSVARESTQSMVETLEEATRELQALRERKDQSDMDSEEQRRSLEKTAENLKSDLHLAEEELRKVRSESIGFNATIVNELEQRLKDKQNELDLLQSGAVLKSDSSDQVEELTLMIKSMESEVLGLRADIKQSEKRTTTLDNLVKSLRTQLSDADNEKQRLTIQIASDEKSKRALQHRVTQLQLEFRAIAGNQKKGESAALLGSPTIDDDTVCTADANAAVKKKNRKKRKGGKSGASNVKDTALDEKLEQESADEVQTSCNTIAKLQEEVNRSNAWRQEKEEFIEKMLKKLKQQEELCEEIETLRDELITIGQEHMVAKDKVKELLAENRDLSTVIKGLERELSELNSAHASSISGSEQEQKDLTEQFEDFKRKATTLQTDLSAAQLLASSRFKDLTDLKGILQKVQPEINALKSEVADSRKVKASLEKKEAEFKQLDSKHEEMRAEVIKLRQLIADGDLEIRTLNQKLTQEISNRLKAEGTSAKTTQEIQRAHIEKRQATESLDKLTKDLVKSQDELAASKAKLRHVEQQYSQISRDMEGLKEDVELKTAQYASAQSLMASMRDQTAEMAIQMKEARDRCESLEEEVSEAHRLLSERSREGETMRRLLADVEGRADAWTREMKERMETANEERRRAEDEASTAGRRKAREVEDLRTKLREAERCLKRAEEDREELDMAQREWKRRREELEQKSEQHTKEMDEVRRAMGELRDALDESERQARELEKQKADMRRSVEDTQHRLEKLQKSHKSMADEIRTVQTAKTKAMDSETQLSRSSLDSMPRPRLGSPASKNRAGSAALNEGINGQAPSPIDFVYLKNVLLQFLEQKDKKHQIQLIPVLGMLLHFDRKDEQRWMSTITAK